MLNKIHTIEELVKLSKEKPSEMLKVTDGRVIVDGEIFNSKEDFERFVKISSKLVAFKNRFYSLFGSKKK